MCTVLSQHINNTTIEYIKNKDKISEKCKIKMHCVCGSEFRIVDKSSHNRTKKHISYIENL